MSDGELIKTTGEIIQEAASGTPGLAVRTTLEAAGGFLSVAGKAVIGGLVKRGMDNLFERYAEAKKDKKIPEDFEETDHGASLLQEALFAMCQGLDEERAEAVKKVFLGLAMNPVNNSLEKVQQIEVMRIAGRLTTWEVVLLNALERFTNRVYDPSSVEYWESASTQEEKNALRNQEREHLVSFDNWLSTTFSGGDRFTLMNLQEAWGSLHESHVLRRAYSENSETALDCIFQRSAAFTSSGWKLAELLYSAEEGE